MNRDSSNLQLFRTSSKQSFTNTEPEKTPGANTSQGLMSYQNKLNKHTETKDYHCNPEFGRHTHSMM